MRENSAYWNNYYGGSSGDISESPSQFAAFVIGEIGQIREVVDVGCGTGRDALFFARHGCAVLGVDASRQAVELCTRKSEELGLSKRTDFICGQVGDPVLASALKSRVGGPLVVYARFFLHAVAEDVESAFIDLARSVMDSGSMLAVEFRTPRDRLLRKETGDHFRRYIDASTLLMKLGEAGFRVEYFVEGFGYAKYLSDDAHAARILCRRDAK